MKQIKGQQFEDENFNQLKKKTATGKSQETTRKVCLDLKEEYVFLDLIT